MLQHAIDQGFMKGSHRLLWRVASTPRRGHRPACRRGPRLLSLSPSINNPMPRNNHPADTSLTMSPIPWRPIMRPQYLDGFPRHRADSVLGDINTLPVMEVALLQARLSLLPARRCTTRRRWCCCCWACSLWRWATTRATSISRTSFITCSRRGGARICLRTTRSTRPASRPPWWPTRALLRDLSSTLPCSCWVPPWRRRCSMASSCTWRPIVPWRWDSMSFSGWFTSCWDILSWTAWALNCGLTASRPASPSWAWCCCPWWCCWCSIRRVANCYWRLPHHCIW